MLKKTEIERQRYVAAYPTKLVMKPTQRYLLFVVVGLAVCVLIWSFALIPHIHLPNSADETTALFHLRFTYNINGSRDQLSAAESANSNIGSGHTYNTKSNEQLQIEHAECEGKPLPLPQCTIYPYVQYWAQQYSKGDCYQSPLRLQRNKSSWNRHKYVVFEPDRGGWNNIRMAAETIILFAHTTGRTLVMPSAMKFYLLTQNQESSTKFLNRKSTINMFLNVDSLSDSLNIISMEEFLENVAKIPGFLPVSLLPDQSVNEIIEESSIVSSGGEGSSLPSTLSQYLHSACYHENWQPGNQFIGFNIQRSVNGDSLSFHPLNRSLDNQRFRSMVATGRQVREYDENFDSHRCIFFPSGLQNSRQRLLTHFYSYLYWEDPFLERVYRRMVRDRLRYQDKIFCVASLIVEQLHAESSKLSGHDMPSRNIIGGNTSDGSATYFSLHYRYHYFQPELYPTTDQVYQNSFHLFDPQISKLLYIATDSPDKRIFQGFSQAPAKLQVRYFNDYFNEEQVEEVIHEKFNRNLIGMIEQVVCANAHTFVGSPFSTFTGYITRLRGKL